MNLLLTLLFSTFLFTLGYYLMYKDYLESGFERIITGTTKSTISYLLTLTSGTGFIMLINGLHEQGDLTLSIVDNWLFREVALPIVVMFLVVIPPMFYAYHSAKLSKRKSME